MGFFFLFRQMYFRHFASICIASCVLAWKDTPSTPGQRVSRCVNELTQQIPLRVFCESGFSHQITCEGESRSVVMFV